ncbi:MAG: transglutaminase-like domain-containing protein [Planctomycetota bacterium]
MTERTRVGGHWERVPQTRMGRGGSAAHRPGWRMPTVISAGPRHGPLVSGLAAIAFAGLIMGCDAAPQPDLPRWREPTPTWRQVSGASRSGLTPLVDGQMAAMEETTQVDPTAPWEQLEVFVSGDEPVGYLLATRTQSSAIGEGVLAGVEDGCRFTERVQMRRVIRENQLQTLEQIDEEFESDCDGTPKRLESRSRLGPFSTHRFADYRDGRLSWETTVAGRIERTQLRLPETLRATAGVRWEVRKRPMEVGEQRAFQMIPIASREIVDVLLVGLAPAVLPDPTGKVRELVEIEATLTTVPTGDQEASLYRRMTLWADRDGVVWQCVVDQVPNPGKWGESIKSVRVDRETFERVRAQIDAIDSPMSWVVDASALGNAPLRQLGIDVKILSSASTPSASVVKSPLPVAPCQYRQLRPAKESDAVRYAISANPMPLTKIKGRFSPFASPVQGSDTGATTLLSTRSGAISRLLRVSAGGDDFTRTEIAESMLATVRGLLGYQAFSGGPRTADQIAASSIADSTEHAVLLATLLRRQEIPCRIAFGFRHDPRSKRPNELAYHAWTVAKPQDEWIILDPISEQPYADRITFLIDDMADFQPGVTIQRLRSIGRALNVRVFASLPQRQVAEAASSGVSVSRGPSDNDAE